MQLTYARVIAHLNSLSRKENSGQFRERALSRQTSQLTKVILSIVLSSAVVYGLAIAIIIQFAFKVGIG
jgi:hypothetical protein